MFRIFNHIRAEYIKTGKLKNYLLYAIGEVILLVIGILLALKINDMNEARKLDIQKVKYLQQVKADLMVEINNFDIRLNTGKDDMEYLTYVFNKQWDMVSLSKFGLTGTRFFYYKPINSGYESMKLNGHLSLIENDGLRTKIVNYFENTSKDLIDFSEWRKNFVVNYLEPYVFTELPIGPDEMIYDEDYLKEKLKELKLNSLISNQVGNIRRTLEVIKQAKADAKQIISAIESEINSFQ